MVTARRWLGAAPVACLLLTAIPAAASGESMTVTTPGSQAVGQSLTVNATGVADGSHQLYVYADESRSTCAFTPLKESEGQRIVALAGAGGEALPPGSFSKTYSYTPTFQLPVICAYLDQTAAGIPDVIAREEDPVNHYLEDRKEAQPIGSGTGTLPGAIEPLPVNTQLEKEFWERFEREAEQRKERERAETKESQQATVRPARRSCHVPRLIGLTLSAARARAREAGCRIRLAGAPVQRPAIQTIHRQRPGPRRTAPAVTVWVNPLCSGSAAWGPPRGEPFRRSGPTELISGLYPIGGPHLFRSAPNCALSGTPGAGTVRVSSAATGVIVASQVVARGQLARIQLAAGTYAISGIFGEAFSNGQHLTGPRTFVVIPAGTTVRQDLTRAIP